MKKYFQEFDISCIEVKTLENENPEYEEHTSLTIDLNDGGLTEIRIL